MPMNPLPDVDRQDVADEIMSIMSARRDELPNGILAADIRALVNVVDNKSADAEDAVIAVLPNPADTWMTANPGILRRVMGKVADKRQEEAP